MPILNPNSTSYEHPWEPNLSDLHTAMDYRPDGKPQLRVGLASENVTISGDVIVSQVEIGNDTGNPIPISANTSTNTNNNPLYVNVVNEVAVKNDLNSPMPVSANTSTNSTANPIYTAISKNTTANSASNPIDTLAQQGTEPWLIKYSNDVNMQMDATDRLRVSQALDTWWYAPTVDKDGDYRYIESITGTAAGSTFVQNLASVSLSSGTDATGSLIRTSRHRHKMRPTVSVRASFSINWNGYDGTVMKRAGLFTDFNGVFFQVNSDLGITLRRRLADGTLIEKTVSRADFNRDSLDGTVSPYDYRPNGPSSFTTGITGYVSTTPVVISGVTMYNVILTVADRSRFFPGLKGRITGITPITFNQITMVSSVSGSTGPGNVTFTMLQDPGVFANVNSAAFSHDMMFHQGVFGFDFNGNRNTHIRFFINGIYGRRVLHIEEFGDALSTPWDNAPALPTRYEVKNLAAPGYRPSFLVSSETVTNEAPTVNNSHYSTAVNNTYITYAKAGTATHPVVGLALRAGEPYQRADIQLQSIALTDLNNYGNQNTNPATFFWQLVLNPTISGTVPASVDIGKTARMWAYTAATTVSGGRTLMSGYCQSQSPAIQVNDAFKDVNLGSNIEYTDSDKIVLVVQQLRGGSNDAQVVAMINFAELL